MSESVQTPVRLPVIDGGRATLSPDHRRAISHFADVIRELSPLQVAALVKLVNEFLDDDYLQRVRGFEVPAVKILAEVINGWEPDGIYEFARAWVSTLVARQDGFDWERCSDVERQEHRYRVLAELQRRGY
ncbi:MAG: hypothetical protein WD733_09585 [Bryobacterales bacterium]